jgi:1-deoxy-D-xylulose-5-phosphate reductoisomerase
MIQRISILGATGSIGQNTLKVLALHPEQYQLVALAAHSNVAEMTRLCLQYRPRYAVLYDEAAAQALKLALVDETNITVLSGQSGLEWAAASDEVDTVMCAIVGAAGLLSTFAAAHAGKRILLANKESLVMAGDLLFQAITQSGATLVPVDSEHNAVLQCFPNDFILGQKPDDVNRITLTASGGPFRQLPLSQLSEVTVDAACAHPTWKMGRKISIDSATLMNKALEVIEAHWLFGLKASEIEVLIHPQSILHSLVEYKDGSFLAHLGVHDMRIPISIALSWPERIVSGASRLNLAELKQLTFSEVDVTRYPALLLGYSAIELGGTASAILNAANEVMVAAFMAGKILFTDIVTGCQSVLASSHIEAAKDLTTVLEADRQARISANAFINETAVV